MFTLQAGKQHAIAGTIGARTGISCGADDAANGHMIVAHALRSEGFDASEDGTGRGTPLVPVPFDTTQITSKANYSKPKAGDPCHPPAAGAHAPAIAYGIRSDAMREGTAKTPSADAEGRIRLRDPGLGITAELAPTVDTGSAHVVAFEWQRGATQNLDMHEEFSPALIKSQTPAVAFAQNQCGELRTGDVFNTLNTNSNASGRNTPLVNASTGVRRLTPRECERLQGFPDDYTAVSYRGKPASDGPRYKALGNSMAVPCMRWIGERIELIETLSKRIV